MSRFEEMLTFVRVIEAGGVTGAAGRLNLAKSAVSRRLSDLEQRLGVQLVARTTRRMTPTETGRAYYERCVRILADLDEADQAVSSAEADLSGTLRVAAPLSFGVRHLSPALVAFLTEHPRIAVDLDLNDRAVNLVEDGFDLAVRIGRLSDSSLIARRLAVVRRVIVASPAYWDREGRPTRPADLVGHQTMSYAHASDSETWAFLRAEGAGGAVGRPATRLRANNGDILAAMAEAGLGVAVLPTFLVNDAVLAGRLECVLPEVPLPPMDAWVLYPPTRHLSHRVRTFIDFMAARFGDPPYWDDCLGR
ncbi:LysR family transcriptional regulator [Roseospira marina]|uniref:LysR family transcriptional regulator n=1 Tax=Roseospira marina TaxID=140057 RepID=A0A5M6IC12_9PROT|nr:LysR family transcriptional regulator [Roseospira marina]KAA5605830.1 LysR family transcriptional regulator [Roseospira marina]MBB4313649.1 DNA-binding transcriptional LysR family regulator [Roseospira marina]MBB5086811.1 DNA-binding transcriptional LysR family regulator [Roseospira marina]